MGCRVRVGLVSRRRGEGEEGRQQCLLGLRAEGAGRSCTVERRKAAGVRWGRQAAGRQEAGGNSPTPNAALHQPAPPHSLTCSP